MTPRVAVLQFPGSNCEFETMRVLRAVGLDPHLYRWNLPAEGLKEFAAFVIPGGFSYQDRIRAGAVAARKPLLNTLAELADEGRPILGICNGAQVLVESGLVPGGAHREVQMALAVNYVAGRTGYFCTWTTVKVDIRTTDHPFLCELEKGDTIPMPIAHAEGRFVSKSEQLFDTLADRNQLPLVYCDRDGEVEASFPTNPNGTTRNVAAVSNRAGNVMALMPHPERSSFLYQVPDSLDHGWSSRRLAASRNWEQLQSDGPGMSIFRSLAKFLRRTTATVATIS